MGFLRRLIGGLSEREVPTAPAMRPIRELEDHRTPTLEGGLDLVPGIGGIEAVGESFYREALVAVTRGSVTTALSTTRNLIVGSRGHEVCPARAGGAGLDSSPCPRPSAGL